MATAAANLTGKVVRDTVAAGSKSEREGVVLEADDGGRYVLRRAGGNPYHDAALERLVGRTITATGIISGRTFIMDEWAEQGQAGEATSTKDGT